MIIKQYYEKCLSQASYYIEHNGAVAIIDPIRDTSQYIHQAYLHKANILYIFETHFHADFVSGHLELARNTGAKIIFGPGAETAFESYKGLDGEYFDLNGLKIKLLHTPGHTLESCCYLLEDESGKDYALFTGDTLFLGDVGRPDLAQNSKISLSQQDLAGMLYDSLKTKIGPLSDELIIFPGHGAGSACGKNLSADRMDLLGNQRKTNYALNISLSKSGFISLVCNGLSVPPPYFGMNVNLNKKGYHSLLNAYDRGENAMSVDEFEASMKDKNVLVLDVRSSEDFAKGHIPGAIHIGLDGSFAPWVGSLIPVDQPQIILICETGRERETITRLARVGYDQCSGYLDGGMKKWLIAGKSIDVVKNIDAEDFEAYTMQQNIPFIDIRNESERSKDQISGSVNILLEKNFEISGKLDTSKEYLVYCAGGYRAMIFISLLKSKGYHGCINVSGGLSAIRSVKNKCFLNNKQIS
ncbi:MBL fold metallo-hydrolase [Pedobacter sp. Leaf41]|uniref:MBL fold metallo-hydrolase n=1 Tax=Pedobacter sp. Leaf41 TaxID=1736218 RepID=UPI0007027D8B|nr:MBL fold metallo-hydrolase [Pedobacter sp. Leaf41]KQN36143.1 MBL fold metallo-hydrolase [Pedobacter sp. Leaf41]